MIMKAFEKVEEIEKSTETPQKIQVRDYKFMTADAHHLPFQENEFDTVVATFTLESTYDPEQVLNEMTRVCKDHGTILIMSRGKSYVSLYSEWLRFKAANDLQTYGLVEHLDIESMIEDKQKRSQFKVFHKERKNMGMTYVFMLEVDKSPK